MPRRSTKLPTQVRIAFRAMDYLPSVTGKPAEKFTFFLIFYFIQSRNKGPKLGPKTSKNPIVFTKA